MKLLKEMTKEERTSISLQCEPTFLSVKKPKVFYSLHSKLTGIVGKKYSTEVWLLITCVVKAIKYGNRGCSFSLSKGVYTTANKIHKQKLSLSRARKVLEVMDHEGFITLYLGYWKGKEDSLTTCVIIEDKLLCMIDKKHTKKFGARREPLSYIEVKDVNDKTILLSTKDFRGYSSLIKDMEKYNNLLSEVDIKVIDPLTGELVSCSPVFKRVFSGDLDSGGRYYSMGLFQCQPSENREFMTINDERCVEWDYCNLHPRICFTIEGITLDNDWDCYDIEGLEWVNDNPKELRSFLKVAYLCVLFSDDKKQAVKGILHKSNLSGNLNINSSKEAALVVDAILAKNEGIRDYFFRGRLWGFLQNVDSKLSSYIINKFTDEGTVCLGWHDSYVVPESEEDKLKGYMKDAWVDLFGSELNFKIEKEF